MNKKLSWAITLLLVVMVPFSTGCKRKDRRMACQASGEVRNNAQRFIETMNAKDTAIQGVKAGEIDPKTVDFQYDCKALTKLANGISEFPNREKVSNLGHEHFCVKNKALGYCDDFNLVRYQSFGTSGYTSIKDLTQKLCDLQSEGARLPYVHMTGVRRGASATLLDGKLYSAKKELREAIATIAAKMPNIATAACAQVNPKYWISDNMDSVRPEGEPNEYDDESEVIVGGNFVYDGAFNGRAVVTPPADCPPDQVQGSGNSGNAAQPQAQQEYPQGQFNEPVGNGGKCTNGFNCLPEQAGVPTGGNPNIPPYHEEPAPAPAQDPTPVAAPDQQAPVASAPCNSTPCQAAASPCFASSGCGSQVIVQDNSCSACAGRANCRCKITGIQQVATVEVSESRDVYRTQERMRQILVPRNVRVRERVYDHTEVRTNTQQVIINGQSTTCSRGVLNGRCQ